MIRTCRHALDYRLSAGAETDAGSMARQSPWPLGPIGPDTAITRCTLLLHGPHLVRILDFEGDLDTLMEAVADHPQVQAAEQMLAPLLAVPTAIEGSASVRALHAACALPQITCRVTAPELLPADFVGAPRRAGLVYPLKPGRGAELQAVLTQGRDLPVRAAAGTALAGTTVFRRDDFAVRLVEVAGDLETAVAHLRNTVSRSSSAEKLAEILRPGFDLRTEAGFERFLTEGLMTVIDDYRVVDHYRVVGDYRADTSNHTRPSRFEVH